MKKSGGILKNAWRDPVGSNVIGALIATGILSIIGGVSSLAQGIEFISALSQFLHYQVSMMYILIGFTFLLFLLIYLHRRSLARHYSRLGSGIVSSNHNKVSFFRPAISTEIEELYREIKALFHPMEIMPLPEFVAIHRKNPKSIWVVSELTVGPDGGCSEARIGFFEFFPLTDGASAQMNRGGKDGTTLRVADITTPSGAGNCYYIGGIGLFKDQPPRLRAVVLNAFYSFLHIVNMQKSLKLYTRPVTSDGMRLVKGKMFKKIGKKEDDMGAIWKLSVPQSNLYHEEFIH